MINDAHPDVFWQLNNSMIKEQKSILGLKEAQIVQRWVGFKLRTMSPRVD